MFEHLTQLQRLTNLCFHSDDYLSNFPQIFKSENSEHFFFEFDKDKLIGFCSIHPTYFTQDFFLKGFCVGSVCTDPQYRGQGIAKKMLQRAQAKAELLSGDFLYLFSPPNPLYEKCGYQFCGKSLISHFSLNQTLLQQREKIKTKVVHYSFLQIQDEKNISFSQLWNFILLHSKASESLLSFLEFKDILTIKNMKIFVLACQEKIYALCFLHKGDDFKNVIHGIYYSHVDYAILLITELVIQEGQNNKFSFFPGVFGEDFQCFFQYQVWPTMYAKILENKSISFADLEKIFIRSLQGT